MQAVHGNGSLVAKSFIATVFKTELGIDDVHVDAALMVLCELGLCHREHSDRSDEAEELFLFPGALTLSQRDPAWFKPVAPANYFLVARRFLLTNPTTTVFNPGLMSQLQVWALGEYSGSHIWRDGVVMPFTSTNTLAEAGVQLHRSHSSTNNSVTFDHVVVVVRGCDPNAKDDCAKLLADLCQKIRELSGTDVVEEALPPQEVGQVCSQVDVSMLDSRCPGFPIEPDHQPQGEVVLGGRRYSIGTLMEGEFVDINIAVLFEPPRTWIGHNFNPATLANPNGGEHLLVEVDKDSFEYKRIAVKLKHTVTTAVVSKIERVQNRVLRSYYDIAVDSIAMENGGDANEIEGWHGTGPTDPKIICQDVKAGFDVNRSAIWFDGVNYQNRRNKFYGIGVYVAHNAIYSHVIRSHFIPGTNDRQLILANVVLGKCFDYGARRVPETEAIAPDGHHSVKGTERNMKCCRGWIAEERREANPNQDTIDKFQSLLDNGAEFGRQYVVNRSNQTYPAYLVTYTA